jgi:SAM-dependent methyltransferase
MASRVIDNHGERLVPGESHNRDEVIRHKSSYRFFKAIILADARKIGSGPLRILDLGCGVGHGSLTLAEIDGSEIVGIDASADAIEYAMEHYAAPNVTYRATSAEPYLAEAQPFDYVVTRHVLEHIPNGLDLALRFPRTRRLLVNVPYKEPARDAELDVTNPHHELNDISEADFREYPRAEFLYEDLSGVTTTEPARANSIICVSSAEDLEPVSSMLSFPFPAWKPNRLEELALSTIGERAAMRRWKPTYDLLSMSYAGLRTAVKGAGGAAARAARRGRS